MARQTVSRSRWRKFFNKLGPGIITGASDDDPSGIATYSQAGALFGLGTLWTAFLSIPLMSAIQEMCARIGFVTSRGLAVTLKNHYPRFWLYVMLLFSIPAITLNIGADIQGMGAVANMIFPDIPAFGFSIFFTLLLMYVIIQFPYRKIARVLKWLCLSLLLYVMVPAMIRLDWGQVLKGIFIPSWQFNEEYVTIIVAILGTTISPYLFFWQATMEAEEHNHMGSSIMVNKRILGDLEVDVNAGMIFSNLVMFFIILTAGTVLHQQGITEITTVDQAARALEPLVGRMAYACFALGVIGTGLLAIPVLAGAQSYLLSETFGWQAGLDKKFFQAPAFYMTVVISLLLGLMLDFLHISAVKALLYTAILYGVTAPVLIAIIIHIGNNKKIMGEFTNNRLSNFFGFLTLIVMSAAALILIWFYFIR